ncbi:MAG: hypothetical protein IPK44_06970 [Candidatus Accumulibacter sp.]|nr:hypothetical protein [Accumulibacter sp.]MBK8114290.1 hypothetical protein [Accumulibacter sp.]
MIGRRRSSPSTVAARVHRGDVFEYRQGRENGRPDGVQAGQRQQGGDNPEQFAAVLAHRRQVEVDVRGLGGGLIDIRRRAGKLRVRGGSFLVGLPEGGTLAEQRQPAPGQAMQHNHAAGQPQGQQH